MTVDIIDNPGSLSVAPDNAPTITTVSPSAAPITSMANNIFPQPVSPSMCPADSTINLLTYNLPPPKPSDNPPSPISTCPTSNSNKANLLPPVIPPTVPEEALTSLLDPCPELTPQNQLAASHPEEVAASTASINS
ncbi:hypothetical protein PtA15_9A338 [Puccinia triticina]|uniref:Uncharacterized protein n=1 Tax=Puccinia triticina TaxID=208348 RepID=A0ABY7CVS7_9BASI|nr:uncharacterized protein PtA15_9A338 [Puccinia triticina]WAQ88211.1 hypothetical protein PtA15_9A338 [Puccinia triticina]